MAERGTPSLLLSLLCAIALAAGLWACGGDGAQTANGPGFGQVYSTIISQRCAGCHGIGDAGPNPGLFFGKLDMSTEQAAYSNLVGVKAAGVSCVMTGETRVVPGNAQESVMFGKVSAPLTMAETPCGDTMPDDGTSLTQDEVTLIQTWINDGANR
jgi:hypothetical protein